MKKLVIILLAVISLAAYIHPEETGTLLKIQVRAAAGEGFEKNLEEKDFKLFINGEAAEIVEFFAKSRSMDKVKSKRNFILVFNITGCGGGVTGAVSRFVEEILKDGDNLFIWSPTGKIYRPGSHGDKKKIAAGIVKILEDDGATYKNDLVTMRDKLENMARMIVMEPTGIKYFISSYARLFNDFKNRHLMPGSESFNQIASYLSGEAGEKWLIHFRKENIVPDFPHFRAVKEKIGRYVAGMKKKQANTAAAITDGLTVIEKTMDIPGSYPTETILDFMLGMNINYNMVLIKDNKSKPGHEGSAPGYERYKGIFESLARNTGGIFTATPDPAAGLARVKKNIDYYYELVFEFDGKLEDKNIKVEVAQPGAQVLYRDRFSKQEIGILTEMMNETGIKITGCTINGYKLVFKITGFKIEKNKLTGGKKTGLVKIAVKLINDKSEVIYQTGKTLKSRQDAIDISLNLPAKFSGYFKLTVETSDLISGRNAKIDKYIKLK